METAQVGSFRPKRKRARRSRSRGVVLELQHRSRRRRCRCGRFHHHHHPVALKLTVAIGSKSDFLMKETLSNGLQCATECTDAPVTTEASSSCRDCLEAFDCSATFAAAAAAIANLDRLLLLSISRFFFVSYRGGLFFVHDSSPTSASSSSLFPLLLGVMPV